MEPKAKDFKNGGPDWINGDIRELKDKKKLHKMMFYFMMKKLNPYLAFVFKTP